MIGFLLCVLIQLWHHFSQCIPPDECRSSSLSIWYTTQHVSQRLLSRSRDLNSNFTAWAKRINVESPAALKIDKSLNRNVVAYKTVIAPSKHCITPGFAVASKLRCALSVLLASSLSLPPLYKKSIGFQIAEEHIWLILNGYSSCAWCFWSVRGMMRAAYTASVLWHRPLTRGFIVVWADSPEDLVYAIRCVELVSHYEHCMSYRAASIAVDSDWQ